MDLTPNQVVDPLLSAAAGARAPAALLTPRAAPPAAARAAVLTADAAGRALLPAGCVRAGDVLLLALAASSAAALAWQAIAPSAGRFGPVTVDRLGSALSLLVAAVGWVTYRFSVRYLDGDARRGRFLGWLALTVASAYALMLSTHLLALLAAWSLTSLGLHQLLTHHAHRPEAIRAARKKFLISRLGDLALLAAIGTIWWHWRTLDLHAFLAAVAAGGGGGGAAAATVGVLVAGAALTKSAQFPFHSWLPETMEAPTPVSALMHAGVINAGGALVLRFAPAVAQSAAALVLLAAVGTATAVIGTLAMWAQVKVKRQLAWSTVGQMGFMTAQCGVGAFAAAALHVVAHGCYKAWSFLRCGELPATAGPRLAPPPVAARRTLARVAVGAAVALPAMVLAARVTGFSPLHSPGEAALAAILPLSAGQVWAAVGRTNAPAGVRAALAAGAIVGGTLAAFALYAAAARFLAPTLAAAPQPTGPWAWVAAALPVLGMLLLTAVHAALPALPATARGRAWRVHALNGFYFGAVADRVVAAVWGRKAE